MQHGEQGGQDMCNGSIATALWLSSVFCLLFWCVVVRFVFSKSQKALMHAFSYFRLDHVWGLSFSWSISMISPAQ